MPTPLEILALEPYYGGSHRRFLDGWRARSRHHIQALTLPAHKWKWRMQTAAWIFAERIKAEGLRPDVIFTTSLLNAAELSGLLRRQKITAPIALYFHESQFSYPMRAAERDGLRRIEGDDFRWGIINAASALASDRLIFNSRYHREGFFSAWRAGDQRMPDERLGAGRLAALRAGAEVIPVGLDLDALDAHAAPRPAGPPIILWNHRWEFDKQPEVLFEALYRLKAEGVPFRLVVCGEAFRRHPPCFAEARRRLKAEILAFGYLPSRADYAGWLWRADIVVSTAIQEFQGLSVLEAMWAGCAPLLPARLSYPELLPEAQRAAHLYADDAALLPALRGALHQPTPYAPRQAWLRRFDWAQIAPQLDASMDALQASA
ncbi:DUF3524 domain-containing protein [Myxococcota bacterium]|nr:DUF3524 domain-containing protein [Myxococcota bacterium]